MNRIHVRFEALRKQGKKALIPFITAGDPEPATTVILMHALVEAGADILELGVPFSDPMADGPVIQRSSERALKHGVSLRDVIAMVEAFRKTDTTTPVVLMGYLNPVEVMGYAAFARAARGAGVDGALTVDMPPEEAHDLVAALREEGIDPVFLIAPTTSDERIGRICRTASGFVYYVSLKGVTGSDKLDAAAVAERVEGIRRHTSLPIGVGFGIKDAESAALVSRVSDAVVVGSALVARMESLAGEPERLAPEVRSFVEGLRQAMDAAAR
jgi:tryptophan synthase alpha chain